MHGYVYRPQTEQHLGPGQPRYILSGEQLSCLCSEFNSWFQIVTEFGFSLNFECFSSISNADLDHVVTKTSGISWCRGNKCYCGSLRAWNLFTELTQ